MSKTLTLRFEHTQLGMRVLFLDNMGTWIELELARYQGRTLDTLREERDYIATLQACRPDMRLEVDRIPAR